MKTHRLCTMVILMAAPIAAERAAQAQVAPATDLEALYADAKADLKAQRYSQALEKFRRGLAADPADVEMRWAYLVGAALSYQGLQQPLAALEFYQRFATASDLGKIKLSDEWRHRRGQIELEASKLEAQVLKDRGAVSVSSVPPGARLTADGKALGVDGDAGTPFVAYLTRGRHAIGFRSDGYQTAAKEIVVETGKRVSMQVVLRRKTEPSQVAGQQTATRPATAATAETAAQGGISPLAIGGHVAFWSGLAIAAFGGVATYLAYASDQAYRAGEWDQESVRTVWNIAAIAAFCTGGAAMAGGLVMWLWPTGE
ncbi:MAG: PEGA domain-containing protein [Deltaproteobacteria bacterium]|nr:PEGA domain-containing protein [Deltaproteobacteria bacterium]